MTLPEILDVIERLLLAAEHSDITAVSRYGDGAGPWGPTKDTSKVKTVSGIKVTHQSTSTASLWAAVWPGEQPTDIPDPLPPMTQRGSRLAVLTVQLLDVARPEQFRAWRLVSLPDLGTLGVSIACADGTRMLLGSSSTGAMIGDESKTDPFPDWHVPVLAG